MDLCWNCSSVLYPKSFSKWLLSVVRRTNTLESIRTWWYWILNDQAFQYYYYCYTYTEHFNFVIVDLESLTCILILGQTEAMKLNCHYLALKWFRILVKITCIHGTLSKYIYCLHKGFHNIRNLFKVVHLLSLSTLCAMHSRLTLLRDYSL